MALRYSIFVISDRDDRFKRFRSELIYTDKMKDNERVTEAAATTSTIHKAQATDTAQFPHWGTQTETHISISVAKPIGIVARKRELVGSWIITGQISGYKVYRRTDVIKARMNMAALRTKKTIER